MDAFQESITLSVTVLAQLFLYLTSLHVDVDAFLCTLGIDLASVKSPDARVPIETYLLIEEKAAEYVRDPYFGLHMGEYFEPGSWSILGYMMMNCRTLGEAFEKSSRYSRIIGNLINARAELHFRKIKIIFSTPTCIPEISRHCYDTIFSSSIRMMRILTGEPIHPLDVTYAYPPPESIAEFQRIFCCPVRFNQKYNSYTVEASLIHKPILMTNPGLLAYFEKYAQDFLAGMDHQSDLTRGVTSFILSHLDNEKLSIGKVAQGLSISIRTLQNRLEGEGTTFSELLREIREKLAKKYLDENYSVEEITYLLGFSEPSAFRKAFKKWSELTPKEYRGRRSSENRETKRMNVHTID